MWQLESLRDGAHGTLRPVTNWLVARRVHPNLLTTLGFLITLSAALAFFEGQVRLAGLFVLLGGLLDILDGQVARLTRLGSKFGAFYDSTLDRISEIAVYLGLLSLLGHQRFIWGEFSMIYPVTLAMAGSLMISYTRARAEALGLDCRVGLMPRAERIVLVGGGALFFGAAWDLLVLQVVIVLLAILTNVTAFQRIVWVYRHAAGVPLDAPAPAGTRTDEDESDAI